MTGAARVRLGEELDAPALDAYLRAHLPALPDASLHISQFRSGASNLTYLLQMGEWQAVLRRPPLGPVPPRAHDMGREAALLKAIHPVFPLAPQPYLACDDLAVLGAPFYVMEFKPGVVLEDRFPPEVQATPHLCRGISETAIDSLAEIHSIPWQTIGLQNFGHPDGFLARQVAAWIERYRRAQTDDVPDIDGLATWLMAKVPPSPSPTVIHNDFKLNNLRLSATDLTRPTAVLDWEMATIGDPLLDLAVALSYWVEPQDPPGLRRLLPTVTTLPGFFTRRECLERYAAQTQRDLTSMSYYRTFAYFKLAVILQQIYLRWRRGQTADERFAGFGAAVCRLIAHAQERMVSGGADD